MSTDNSTDLVIAVDYYDGEAEGLARHRGACNYFRRVAVDLPGDVNEYVSIEVDCSLLEAIAGLIGADANDSTVFVYSGASEAANRRLDELIPPLRSRADQVGRKTRGHTYLDSMQRAR